jgi:hypothetical protein
MSLIKSDMEPLPDYLSTEVEKVGVDQIKNFVKPPRLKVIQAQSDSTFTDQFQPGDVIIVPQMLLVSPLGKDASNGKPNEVGQPFTVQPIFFFPEWCVWNPLETKGTLPMLGERSLDPNGQLAIYSRDPSKREFVCPTAPQYKCKIQEHLNFVFLIDGEAVIASFHRGSYTAGQTLLTLIQMRDKSLFACKFQAQSTFQSNKKGKWYGLTFTNPTKPAPAWASKEEYELGAELHRKFSEAHAANTLIVDHEAESESVAESSSANANRGAAKNF